MARWVGLPCMVLALGMLLLSAASVRAQEADARPHAVAAVNHQPKAAAPGPQSQWLDRIAEFFRVPIVYIALITVGIIGLIFEFKLPGTTFPGSVAALCFVLFFWAHSF